MVEIVNCMSLIFRVDCEITENANVQEGVFCCIFCLLFGFFLLILWLKCRWLMLDSGMVTFCCFY